MQRDIADISPKMLSQELKALELNKILTRTGKSSMKLINELLKWGLLFRKEDLIK